MANTHATPPDANKYYIPHDSHWPIFGSVALFMLMLGAIAFLNEWAGGWVFLPGAVLLIIDVLRLVPHRHRREPARHLQPAGGPARSAWE